MSHGFCVHEFQFNQSNNLVDWLIGWLVVFYGDNY